MTEKNNKNILYCSFCGKSQHEVRKLIAGPSVYICNECIDLCNDIILEEINEGLSFEEAAKKYSEDPGSKDNGGYLGFVPRGTFVKEFEKVLIEHFGKEEQNIIPVMLNIDNKLYRKYRSYLSWKYYFMY